ncbi:protein CrcB CrcB [Pantoea ananatis AJ13355]|uniref:Protein CrcB CrcB n=1 Tax=Pantoea ananatis (strain AJ13355) TaxID=932677 RepID=A0A0H3L196_PANAA|nr:protein CrcB CrcB [Pantoea ananatis AJ13355]
MSAKPAKLISNEPMTCTSALLIAHRYLPVCNKVINSAVNVENVVSPPHKPVMMSNRQAGSSEGFLINQAIAPPITNPPIKFTSKVPGGRLGKNALKRIPNHQRSTQPTLPPKITANSGFNITDSISGFAQKRVEGQKKCMHLTLQLPRKD